MYPANQRLLDLLHALHAEGGIVFDGDDPEDVYPGIGCALHQGLVQVVHGSGWDVGVRYFLTARGRAAIGKSTRVDRFWLWLSGVFASQGRRTDQRA